MATVAAATKATPTAAERAAGFLQTTRENLQPIPYQSTTDNNATLQFELPKARLLSRLILMCEVSVKITHASGTAPTVDDFSHLRMIRNITLDLNNGFMPFRVTGLGAGLYGMCRYYNNIYAPQSSNAQGFTYVPTLVASSGGTNNVLRFAVDLPVTLNDRDPVALVLLQNDTSRVMCTVDLDSANALVGKAAGYTCTYNYFKISPMVQSFTIPDDPNNFPDISAVKLVSSQQYSFLQGENTIKMSTGNVYRKIIMRFLDATGAPLSDSDMSNIMLKFNQADTAYNVTPAQLRAWQQLKFAHDLPQGVYAFDFGSYPGMCNMAGSRDLIDTKKLTELWVTFNSVSKTGTVEVLSEMLARTK